MRTLQTSVKNNVISPVVLNYKTSLNNEFSDNKSEQLKKHYNFEQKTIDFIRVHGLINFLLWINNPIVKIFGNIKKTLHLTKCWDEEEYHLVLTIFSKQDDMDQLTRLDDTLFEKLEKYFEIDYILQYVVIAQR